MASLTGNLVAETYKALLKTIDNDILTASEKQITDGFGGGSNVFIDSNGFLRANKYKVTNGLATQFLKADGSLDANTYLTSITSSQIITALGFTPVTNARTLTINGTTYDLSANRSWTVAGTAAVWGNITGTLSNQTDLQNALNAKFNNPAGTISQYIRGDGSLATFPTLPGGLPIGGTAGQILAKINSTDYNAEWIDNFATQTKNEVKLGQTLAKGAAVYVSSANGTNIIVSAASNVSEALSSKTFGLLETGGSTNAFVKCVTFGLLAGLDTSTATAGDPVWLGVNGALIFGLANKPYAPAHLVYIGVVTRVQSNNGEIFVNVQDGFELKEIHDVSAQSPTNNQGLFYESSTGLWKNKSIATVLGYTPQAQLSGTGFVKASGTTISYDNSTYLTTTDAATTYQRLDKMVSNLLASATEYPNSNAVITALALKADAANPVFTGNMTISGAEPKLTFTDTDQNPDYFIGVDAGFFRIYDQTAGLTRFVINSSGVTTIAGDLIVGTIAKTGGTASQFLKADGSVDSSTYVTSATLANYLLSATASTTYQTLANLSTDLTASATKYPSVNAVVTGLGTKQPLDADLTAIAALVGTTGFLIKTAADTWSLDTNTYLTTVSAASTYLTQTTAASTYQRLDKMVSNLLASSTEYPNSNAVLAKLALKADAANPVFTGDLTISGATPRLYFVDTDQNPDYTIFVDSGFFYIYDQTAGATRFSINSSGNISTGANSSFTAGSSITGNRFYGQYTSVLNTYTTVNPSSNVLLMSPPNDRDAWIYLDQAATTSNYGIYHRQIDSAVGNLPANSIGFIGGGSSALQAYISLDNGNGYFAGNLGVGTIAGYSLDVSTSGGIVARFTGNSGAYLILKTNGVRDWWLANGVNSGTDGWFGLYNATAATNAFAITSGNNFLVGTTTDSGYKFDVNGTGRFSGNLTVQSGYIQVNGSSNGYLNLNATSTGGNESGIFFQVGGGNKWENYTANNDTALNWYSYASSAIVLKLATTGTATFSSSNSDYGQLRLIARSGAESSIGFRLNGDADTASWVIGKGAGTGNTSFGFYYGGTKMVLTSGGNLGVGTATPSATLHVVGTQLFDGNGAIFKRTGVLSGQNWNLGIDNAGLSFYDNTNNAYRFIITGGGNILINTNTDNGLSKLQVNGGIYGEYLRQNSRSGDGGTTMYTGSTGSALGISNGTSTATINRYTYSGFAGFVASNSEFYGICNDHEYGGPGAQLSIISGQTTGTIAFFAGTPSVKANGAYQAPRVGYMSSSAFVMSVNITAPAFFESSDIRLKTLIDGSAQISGIENLQAKLYEKNGKIEFGYFAQDAQEFMPYAVEKNMDGFLSLSYREVHTAKIARLEQRVAELEKQLNAA